MKRIVIFGCGIGGQRALESLNSEIKVIAFCDNDEKKHDQAFLTYQVVSPLKLANLQFDEILIASQYYEDICQQLIDLDVPTTKISFLPLETLYSTSNFRSTTLRSIKTKSQACFLFAANLLVGLNTWASIFFRKTQTPRMIAIVDVGLGNIRSVQNMIEWIGHSCFIASTPKDLSTADKIILPGVGSFDAGITALQNHGFVEPLTLKALDEKIPILGICLGAQIMTRTSEEGSLDGLGWLDAEVVKFNGANLRLPHVGWSQVKPIKPHPITKNLPASPKYYFLHSYHLKAGPSANVILESEYGLPFPAAVSQNNLIAVQFHPEKSHQYGIALMKNFLDL